MAGGWGRATVFSPFVRLYGYCSPIPGRGQWTAIFASQEALIFAGGIARTSIRPTQSTTKRGAPSWLRQGGIARTSIRPTQSTTKRGAPGPSSAAAEGPGIARTSIRPTQSTTKRGAPGPLRQGGIARTSIRPLNPPRKGVPQVPRPPRGGTWDSTNLNPPFSIHHEKGCPRSLVRRGGGTWGSTNSNRIDRTAP